MNPLNEISQALNQISDKKTGKGIRPLILGKLGRKGFIEAQNAFTPSAKIVLTKKGRQAKNVFDMGLL